MARSGFRSSQGFSPAPSISGKHDFQLQIEMNNELAKAGFLSARSSFERRRGKAVIVIDGQIITEQVNKIRDIFIAIHPTYSFNESRVLDNTGNTFIYFIETMIL